jgi:hypothetical protein
MKWAPPWALLFVVASINALAAQDEAPRIFVDGTGFIGFERTTRLSYETPLVSDRDASGTVGGGGFSVGTFLAPRVSLRLEAAFPGSLDSSYSVGSGFAVSPLGEITEFVPQRVQEERRERSASVLLGYHTERRHRVRLGFLAGVAFLWQQQHSETEQTIPGFPPFVPLRIQRTDLTATTYRPATAVGVEADVAMARHVALIPQMRVHAVAGALSLRPGIAVRWTP